jgi:hypothetical protein
VKAWLSFNLSKCRDGFKQPPILQLSQIIQDPKIHLKVTAPASMLDVLA